MKRLKNFVFIAALFGMAGSVSAEVVFEETFVKSNSLIVPVCVNVASRENLNSAVTVELMGVHKPSYNIWANAVIDSTPSNFSGSLRAGTRKDFSIDIPPGIDQECVNFDRRELKYEEDMLIVILDVENSEYLDISVPMAVTGITDNSSASHQIMIEQLGNPTRVVNSDTGFGTVNVTLNSEDLESDPLIIDWSATDDRIISLNTGDENSAVLQFNPSSLEDDVYKLTVGVIEEGADFLDLNAVVLSEYIVVRHGDVVQDSDLDGVSDATEGGSEFEIIRSVNEIKAFTQSGVKLRLSEIPLKSGLYSPELTYTKFQEASEILPDQNHGFFSYVSFEVEGIEVHGARVGVIIHLDTPFPFVNGAVFPFINDEVKSFAPDTSFDSRRDYALGAKSEDGQCPPINKEQYDVPSSGDDCVLLLITDGGANDADFQRNGRVTFNAFLGESQDIFDSDDSTKAKSKMGPGSFNLSVIAALIVLLSYRAFRKK